MAPAATELTKRDPTQSPYQLDQPAVRKASTALVTHMRSEAKKKQEKDSKKSLFAAGDEDDEDVENSEPINLIVTTKKHIVDVKRLKPTKVKLPHSLNKSNHSICLITADPQRTFKDAIAHPSFPPELAGQIRVLGLSKLKARTKSFQEKRQLLQSHDVFMADDRVITTLPKILGKVFYSGTKWPIPVRIQDQRPKENGKRVKAPKDNDNHSVASPKALAQEIEKTLASAIVHISPSVNTHVQVGFTHFTGEQIQQNVHAVVDSLTEKVITKGWRNIKSLHIKGPHTIAFPLWMASELWTDEADVLEDEEAEKAKQIAAQKGKRKSREIEDTEGSEKKKTKLLSDEGFNKEMSERREKLRQAKREARDKAANGSTEMTTETTVTSEGGKKKKTKKTKVVETTVA